MTLSSASDFQLVGRGSHGVIGVHGWFGPDNTWSALPGAVDLESNTFALFPLRGYGSRVEEPGERSIDAAALDVIALADELGWETFSVLGHSMGGKTAQRVLTLVPDRVRKVVAVCAVPATGVPFDDATAGFFRSASESPEARRAIIDRSTGNRLESTLIDQMVSSSLENSSPQAFSDYLESWAFEDFSELMVGFNQDVLAVVGDQDPDITEGLVEATFANWFPHLTLSIALNCGHYPILENPSGTMSLIQNFLNTTND